MARNAMPGIYDEPIITSAFRRGYIGEDAWELYSRDEISASQVERVEVGTSWLAWMGMQN